MEKIYIIIPNLQWRKLILKEIKILIPMLYTKNDILVSSTKFHFPDLLHIYDKDPFMFFFKLQVFTTLFLLNYFRKSSQMKINNYLPACLLQYFVSRGTETP